MVGLKCDKVTLPHKHQLVNGDIFSQYRSYNPRFTISVAIATIMLVNMSLYGQTRKSYGQ